MIASNSSPTWPGTATVVIRVSTTDDVTATAHNTPRSPWPEPPYRANPGFTEPYPGYWKQIELERELALERIRDEGRGRFPWEAIGPDAPLQRPQEALRVPPKDFARRRAPWQRDRALAREAACS